MEVKLLYSNGDETQHHSGCNTNAKEMFNFLVKAQTIIDIHAVIAQFNIQSESGKSK